MDDSNIASYVNSETSSQSKEISSCEYNLAFALYELDERQI